MSAIRIGIIAICGMIMAMFIKENKSPIHIMVSLATGLIITAIIVSKLSGVISSLSLIGDFIEESEEYIVLLIKIIGITYVTQFSSDICKDNGYSALAGQLEVFGKLTIAAISIPVIGTLFEVMSQCLS